MPFTVGDFVPTGVPFLDVGATYRELKDDLLAAQRRVLESGWYVLGEEVAAFEREFADACGAQHCVGVGNGLDALVLGLRAVGAGPGDEVIVPSNTYIATWLAVSAVGATVVPVDPDPGTYNLLAEGIASAVTDRTKVVLPVHLYGQAAAMTPILAEARRFGLKVVADAAQAHGATYGGQSVGALGDVVCWSFYPGKNLGCFGDGGAITTSSDEIADEVRLLRNYGSRQKYVNERQGVNSRLDELQAAMLRVKLEHLDAWNARRASLADRYLAGLAGAPGVTLPTVLPEAEPVWHLFVIRHRSRDQLRVHLERQGVQTLIHYPIAPGRQEAYRHLGASVGSVLADRLADEVLSLPIGPHLAADAADIVIEAIWDFEPSE